MKIAFKTRLRAMLGVSISILSMLLFLVATIFDLFVYGDFILSLYILSLLIDFVALVFYFADAFRCNNKPDLKITKILNDIVLLVLILGILPTFLLNGYSSLVSFGVYNIVLTSLVIISVVYDMKKCRNNIKI